MVDPEWNTEVDERPADRFELDDLAAVAEVTHPIRGRTLRRLKHAQTVAELADQLDVPVTRLYHHINRLEDAGLIRVVATRRVGAATERRYQAVARSFEIAPRLFEELAPAELAQAMGGVFDLAKLGLQRSVEAGELRGADLDERGVLALAEVNLVPARRAELLQRLRELLTDFGSDDDGEPMTMFIAAYEEPV